MASRRILAGIAGIVLLGGVVGAGYVTRDMWLTPAPATSPGGKKQDEHDHSHAAGEVQQVKLTPQAQANLRLDVKPLKAETYWRTTQVPGSIIDRPAQSDRGVVAPVTGVVTRVHRFPGDTVKPGTTLFTLKLLSETLQLTQSELFKTTQEQQITQERKKRLAALATSGGVSEATLIDIDNQLRRLGVAAHAYRTELSNRGFNPEQIDRVTEGKFVSMIEIAAPGKRTKNGEQPSDPPEKRKDAAENEPTYEIQELKVELGQQVQAGQVLCLLSNHQWLYIEGRAFRQETPFLEKSAKEGWPVDVEFMEERDSDWPQLKQIFTIRHIANTIDPASRTFAFYIPLANQSRSFDKDDRTLLLRRFRPGQKVRMNVRVEKLDNVFVLPAEAVVREGPDAYVFRQNGDLFDRKPVHVLLQERQKVIVANDGSVPPGLYVAQNGAMQINRVLKSGTGGLPPGFHMHADGSIHSNSTDKTP